MAKLHSESNISALQAFIISHIVSSCSYISVQQSKHAPEWNNAVTITASHQQDELISELSTREKTESSRDFSTRAD